MSHERPVWRVFRLQGSGLLHREAGVQQVLIMGLGFRKWLEVELECQSKLVT